MSTPGSTSPTPQAREPGLTTSTIQLGEIRLHIRRTGLGTGPPVLLLHGGVGSGEDFEPLLPWLDDHDCVLLDTRAHGASTGNPQTLSYPRLADDVEAVIEALRLDHPILLGHSDGGVTALHVAARRRVSLGGLITVGASCDPPSAEIRKRFYASASASMWRRRFPAVVARYEALNPAPDFDGLLAGLLRMWQDDSAGQFPGEAVGAIACPCLVLGGEADHLVPWTETAALAQRIPGACMGLYPYGGHLLHEDHPDRIAPAIRTFLDLGRIARSTPRPH